MHRCTQLYMCCRVCLCVLVDMNMASHAIHIDLMLHASCTCSPELGFEEPVRVCDACYTMLTISKLEKRVQAEDAAVTTSVTVNTTADADDTMKRRTMIRAASTPISTHHLYRPDASSSSPHTLSPTSTPSWLEDGDRSHLSSHTPVSYHAPLFTQASAPTTSLLATMTPPSTSALQQHVTSASPHSLVTSTGELRCAMRRCV